MNILEKIKRSGMLKKSFVHFVIPIAIGTLSAFVVKAKTLNHKGSQSAPPRNTKENPK
jgi:hypothetical protein